MTQKDAATLLEWQTQGLQFHVNLTDEFHFDFSTADSFTSRS